MRKLVLILIAFIAVATFIRAFDNSGGIQTFHAANGTKVGVNGDPVSDN